MLRNPRRVEAQQVSDPLEAVVVGRLVDPGGVATKQWSSTQATVALFSGEAEYINLVRAATDGVVSRPWPATSGGSTPWYSTPIRPQPKAWRAGRPRHIECRVLWFQEAPKSGRFRFEKVTKNGIPADLFTTPRSASELVAPSGRVGATLVRREWSV